MTTGCWHRHTPWCTCCCADVPLNSIKFVRGHNNPASQDDKDGPRGPGGGRGSGERGGGRPGARGGQGMDGKDASGKLNRPGEQNCQVRCARLVPTCRVHPHHDSS